MSQTPLDSASEAYTRRWAEALENDESYYVPEKYQLGIVTDYLDRHEISYTTEGDIFCYPIDIVAAKRDTTLAIELKSRNVGKGIEQACRNADYVDYSFLSVWESNVTETLIDRVADLDIGLIGVDDRVRIYSPPSKNSQQLCKRSSVFELIDDVRSDPPVQQSQRQGHHRLLD
ncbi:hypothetical protein ACOZ4N_00220 (plasmid) [Halorientalis pallida]|uniref:hypothetical protein n=1 Tax=Halorientalis pallida TaxID=2479928 RepID=UPI003C700DB4